ncbi:hypothetical protein [uncultured Rheinheimera sp.]|uniref:hypothetical protein n=1 Tax=uncultured Rheinheimera sp. TaxID=400532 RepID=UPI00259ADB58|nr:hypothetical protein [uncultured Rheinheimera sp.]
MHSVKNKALRCACGLLMTHSGISFASPEVSVLQQLPPLFISSEEKTSDWIQANKKVAELGGWQFYMQEAGGHAAMDHSQHSGHSGHKAEPVIDNSQHSGHGGHMAEPDMDHSQHSGHGGHMAEPAMDHSQHSGQSGHKAEPAMDHSQHSGHSGHKAEPAMDHSQHSGHATSKQTAPKPAAGDQHEHHH